MSEILTVTLPSELAAALRYAVIKGEYADVDAALADALTTWSRREEEAKEELAWTRAKVRASILDPRPSLTMNEVRAQLDEVFAQTRMNGDEAA